VVCADISTMSTAGALMASLLSYRWYRRSSATASTGRLPHGTLSVTGAAGARTLLLDRSGPLCGKPDAGDNRGAVSLVSTLEIGVTLTPVQSCKAARYRASDFAAELSKPARRVTPTRPDVP
jgi:hypothetical protein